MPAVTCNNLNIISIHDLKGRIAVGEHAWLEVSGLCQSASAESLQYQPLKHSLSFTSTTTGTHLFTGLIGELDVDYGTANGNFYVKAVSHDILTDMEPKVRTFQNSSMTYRQMFSIIEGDSNGFSFRLPEKGGDKIGKLLVQYKETDWQYSKRIAGLLKTVVIPDCQMGSPTITIGVPHTVSASQMNVISYRAKKNLEQFHDYNANNVKGFNENDSLSYIAKSRDAFNLCDPVQFNGTTQYIYAIDIALEGEEIVYYYTLKDKSSFVSKMVPNYNLIGATLIGKVREVQSDQVQMEVDGDVKQSGYRWFTYATPFSEPDGPAWFFEPEIGDQTRMVFQDEEENNSYISSGVHITHGTRTDPKVKFIRTVYNQEIYFDPTILRIDDGKGSSITMDIENDQMLIETNKNLKIVASQDIEFSSNGKINVAARKSIGLQQGRSIISVTDKTLTIASPRTKIQ